MTELTRTELMSFPGGRQPGPLGTKQTPWECVPLLLITHIKCQPCCQVAVSCYLSPGFLRLNPQVKVTSRAVSPSQTLFRVDKGAKTKKDHSEREAAKQADSTLHGLMIQQTDEGFFDASPHRSPLDKLARDTDAKNMIKVQPCLFTFSLSTEMSGFPKSLNWTSALSAA